MMNPVGTSSGCAFSWFLSERTKSIDSKYEQSIKEDKRRSTLGKKISQTSNKRDPKIQYIWLYDWYQEANINNISFNVIKYCDIKLKGKTDSFG